MGADPEAEYWSDCQISAETVGDGSGDLLSQGLREIAYSPLENKNYRLTLLRGVEIDNGEFAFTTIYNPESKYKLVLLHLSDEAYGYFNAMYNKENNFLGKLGLAPANYAYTNIVNGYGVFGAVDRSEKLIKIK